MNKRQWAKGTVMKVNPFSNFTVRVLSVGHVEMDAHQWLVPDSHSMFWSLYITGSPGLELGTGKDALQVPAGSISLVPPGASAARDNSKEIKASFLHFDIGGFTGVQLIERLDQIAIASSQKFKSQIAELEEAIGVDDVLRLQLCAQELLAGVLADCVSVSTKKRPLRCASNEDVQQILPAIYAIEERLNSPIYRALKIDEMAAICDLKPVDFSRIFFKAIGKNPAEFAQSRRIAIAVQQLLFTEKSIDEVSSSMTFANRFYFSRMFKDAVGVTPAAYRAAIRA